MEKEFAAIAADRIAKAARFRRLVKVVFGPYDATAAAAAALDIAPRRLRYMMAGQHDVPADVNLQILSLAAERFNELAVLLAETTDQEVPRGF